MDTKKTTPLSKDSYISLVRRLTDDDANPKVDQIDKIRKAVRTPRKPQKKLR